MKKRKFALLFLLGLILVPLSEAQIKHIEMRVEGMTCNFCAFGVKQYLGRQAGVQKVEVTLLNGKVDITPKEDGQITSSHILKATFDSGVTVAEMDLTARGKIVRDSSGNFVFCVDPNQVFTIIPNELLKRLEPLVNSPTIVTVYGELYRKPAGEQQIDASVPPKFLLPLKLLILDVQKRE